MPCFLVVVQIYDLDDVQHTSILRKRLRLYQKPLLKIPRYMKAKYNPPLTMPLKKGNVEYFLQV